MMPKGSLHACSPSLHLNPTPVRNEHIIVTKPVLTMAVYLPSVWWYPKVGITAHVLSVAARVHFLLLRPSLFPAGKRLASYAMSGTDKAYAATDLLCDVQC
eukprot:3936575-Rhodomonas_salina.3